MSKKVSQINMQNMMKPSFYAPKSKKWQGWKKRVCIAVPTTGLVRVEWMMARFGQVIPVNWSNSDIFQFFDQFSPMGWAVADARNICVEYSITGGFEWTLFIDHDVILPPHCFLKMNAYMRSAKYPVVCGLYWCKGSHPEPLLFRGRGTSYYDKWKAGDKVQVDGIPMGCTLIHNSLLKVMYDTSQVYTCSTMSGPVVVRRVFETPRQAWFDPEKCLYNTRVGTEDLFWCDRVMREKVFEKSGVPQFKKFQKMKYPFLLDTSIVCKHIDENGRQYP
ncbi:hypothetical protein ACFL2J_05525 [Candidatus Omnitrophota bacterium]